MDEEVKTEEPKKSKVSLVLIIVIFLFLLLLVIVGAIGFLMFSSPSDEAPVVNQTNEQQVKPANQQNQNTNRQRGSDFANIGVMFVLEPFTVNLLSNGGQRYLKCSIQLEQNNELLQAELEKKVSVIRDIVIRTLTSKTYEEISTTRGKERLKDELVGRINEILNDGFIKDIYFTDFVVS
ncbi:flagellar basal body-associated protein FliL [uncultured Campylobacter sp.]|uniref:flagellar basal body-associated protein FliL n=1 Tax=uncultured Campylobacter sp. TaxID=218934 RepID=UPI00262D63F4|nr:flagellar basal body-associated protein FliL [uncultured Campylobacter sp.]